MKRYGVISIFLAVASSVSGAVAEPVKVGVQDTTLLQEVTVTAVKQGRLDALPLSSSVVSAQETERLSLVSVKGISDVVPNFFVPDYGSRMTSSIYVRGIGARIDQPAVGLNVDNVPFFNKDAYDFDLTDISEVEMLRGPQSTLYGRNTMGGVVNITTLSPMQWRGVRALLDYGRANSLRASASVYLKPAESVGLAVNAYYTRTDGFFVNDFNGRKADRENQFSGRIKAEWRISPTLYLSNTAAASRLRQGGYPYEYVRTGRISYNDTCFYRRACFNDGLTLKLSLPEVTLTSISSAQYIDDNMTLDQDFLPLPYFTLTQKRREWVLTQDFVARSTGARAWQWLGGVFGFYRNSHMQAPVEFLDEGIGRLIEDHRNEANPDFPIVWQSRNLLLSSAFSNPGYGLAAYHESTLNLGLWHITAGLRLDYEHTSLSYHSACDSGYEIMHREADGSLSPYRYVPVVIADRNRLGRHFLELLPKLGVVWDIPAEAQANVYVSVAKGYKAGGFNTQMFSDVLQQRLMGVMGIGASYDIDRIVTYKPEKSWNFEVGSHFNSSDGKVRSQLSLFYILCRDQQLTMFPDGTTTGRVMTNAGRSRSWGGELSVTWLPVKPLALRMGYGFTDARFTEFFNGMKDYAGKHVPYAPCHTLFVGASGDITLPWSVFPSLQLSADLSGDGPIYWNEENSLRQNFYARLGMSVALVNPRFSLMIWGKNLTDTRYDTFYFVSMGNEFMQRGKPVTFGATLRLELNI